MLTGSFPSLSRRFRHARYKKAVLSPPDEVREGRRGKGGNPAACCHLLQCYKGRNRNIQMLFMHSCILYSYSCISCIVCVKMHSILTQKTSLRIFVPLNGSSISYLPACITWEAGTACPSTCIADFKRSVLPIPLISFLYAKYLPCEQQDHLTQDCNDGEWLRCRLQTLVVNGTACGNSFHHTNRTSATLISLKPKGLLC